MNWQLDLAQLGGSSDLCWVGSVIYRLVLIKWQVLSMSADGSKMVLFSWPWKPHTLTFDPPGEVRRLDVIPSAACILFPQKYQHPI